MESALDSGDRKSILIWVWLVALLGAGTLVFSLPMSRIPALVVIFGIALVKAVLVVRDYMHLKTSAFLIYVILLLPVLLAAGFALVLIPDLVLRR